MRLTTRLGSLAAIAASLSLVAGCAGGNSQIPSTGSGLLQHSISQPVNTMSTHRFTSYRVSLVATNTVRVTLPQEHGACGSAIQFISDFNNSVVNMYSAKKLCGQITGLSNPQGLTIDSSHNLWVANTGASNVLEFKPPYTGKPAVTLSDASGGTSYFPTDIALCKGYRAVTNIESTTGGAGNVEIFVGTAKTPTRSLSDTNGASERFDSCDAAGNLFTTYLNGSGTGSTNEWLLGKGKAKELTALATTFPGGIQYEAGKLWVDNQSGPTISLSSAPYTKVSKVITLSGASDPVSFQVSPSDLQILTGDAGLNAGEFYTLAGKNTGSLAGNSGGLPIGASYNSDDAK